jgi:exosome complex RNA-binding protein Rrp42 (RNase PH superfamily)
MSFPPYVGDVEALSLRRHLTHRLQPHPDTALPARLDGRGAADVRPCAVVRDVAPGSVASLQLALGDTLVAAGLSLSLGPTKESRPGHGRMNVRVSSGLVEDPAPCRVLETFLNDVLSSCFNLRQLLVLPNEACWVVTADVVVIAADGGLREACLYAVALLLDGLQLPRAKLPNDTYTVPATLRLSSRPLCVTLSVLFNGDVILSDATAMEELAAEQLVTVVVDASASLLYAALHGGHAVGSHVLEEAIRRTVVLAQSADGSSPWK